MDIVDAQVHANMLGTEVTVAIMDALGIQAFPVRRIRGGGRQFVGRAFREDRLVGRDAKACRVEGMTKPFSHLMGSWRISAWKPVQSSIPACIRKFGLHASSWMLAEAEIGP
jgi:hypothetical protein